MTILVAHTLSSFHYDWLVHVAGCLFKVFSPDPFDQPPAKLGNQLTAPAVHNIALEVGGEGVGEWLTSIHVATTEHSSGMMERNVVVIWYDLKLSESNTIIESYGGDTPCDIESTIYNYNHTLYTRMLARKDYIATFY